MRATTKAERVLTSEAEQFRKDGFFVARGVLDASEIERLTNLVNGYFTDHGVIYRYGKTQPNAAVLVPDISWLLSHSRVLDAYRNLLPDMELCFTSHCDLHWNMGFSWHKDDGQGRYMKGDYFNEERFIIKAGLYLNDTSDGSGMTVRRGSHRTPDLKVGDIVQIHTRPGDVVFFDVRITHMGKDYTIPERVILKAGKICGDTMGRAPLGFEAREIYRKLSINKPKRSIFFTFGRNDPDTQYFAQINMERQFEQTGICKVNLPENLLERFTAEGISVCRF
jgi:hypothetical protein